MLSSEGAAAHTTLLLPSGLCSISLIMLAHCTFNRNNLIFQQEANHSRTNLAPTSPENCKVSERQWMGRIDRTRHPQRSLTPGVAPIASAYSSGLESRSSFQVHVFLRCILRPAVVAPRSPCSANCRPKPSWLFCSPGDLDRVPYGKTPSQRLRYSSPTGIRKKVLGGFLSGDLPCFPLSCWSCACQVTFELTPLLSEETKFFGTLSAGPPHFLRCPLAKNLLFAASGSSLSPGACASGRRLCLSPWCSVAPI